MSAEDTELLRRYAETRSEDAFAEIVRRHVNLVYSVALRQVGGDTHLAQDVTQTVFAALARKARKLSQYSVLGGWLYRSTQFAASDVVRAERKRRAREQEIALMHETLGGSMAEPDWEKIRPVLDEAISELDAGDRDAIWLRYFESRNFPDIGRRLRLTESGARMRVERALEKLHVLVAQRGISSTTAALAIALGGQSTIAAPAHFAATLAQAALAGIAAPTAAAGVGWTFFHLMSTTKTIVGVAGIVSIAAAGISIRQSLSLRDARVELAAARDAEARLQARTDELERRLTEQSKVAAAADEETARLLALIGNAASPKGVSSATVPEPITQATVQARYQHAQQLDRNGQLDEALAEYLWCYDTGMPRVTSMSGVRSSGLLSDIARLGERLPAALVALRERRDAAEQRALASADDFDAAMTMTSINRVLKEDDRSIQFYDRLPEGDPRRDNVGRLLFEQFATARRYSDAARAKSYNSMSSQLEMFMGRTPTLPETPEKTEAQKKRLHNYTIRSAAMNIEVLAGVGDIEHAADLAARVLEYDSSPETVTQLDAAVSRAGQPGLIAALRGK